MAKLLLIDGEHENARVGLDEAYKANRPDLSTVPEEENPYSQLGDIYRALDYLQIKHFETTDCEADDVIASYALTLENTETVISSFDSDLFQLLSEHVSVLRYRGKNTVIYTPALFREKFGISPAQYADFISRLRVTRPITSRARRRSVRRRPRSSFVNLVRTKLYCKTQGRSKSRRFGAQSRKMPSVCG